MSGDRVRYTVLGPLGFAIDGEPRTIGGPKQRAIFAALVIAQGRTVSAESLANAAWNGDPPPNYSATVQVFIAGFRRLFRDAGLDPKAHLVTAAPGYRLVQAEGASDLARFDATVRLARNTARAGRTADAASEFRAAVGEFTGAVLADLRGLPFADEFAVAVEEQRLDAVTEWAAAEIASGRAEFTIVELTAVARAHPLREPLWEQLVRALYAVGRQTDALEACRRLRATLADDLGIDPSAAIRDLEAKILRQEPLETALPVSAAQLAATVTEDDDSPPGRGRICEPSGRSYEIPPNGLHIGRMPDNDVVIDHPKVSRYHAVVSGAAAGFVVRDLRSSNGTRINDMRIPDPTELNHGDRIGIGLAVFVFELDDTAP